MGDQRPAAIDADNINVLVRERHVLHPVAGATGQVEHMLEGCGVYVLGEEAAHILGQQPLLVDEQRYFRAARVNQLHRFVRQAWRVLRVPSDSVFAPQASLPSFLPQYSINCSALHLKNWYVYDRTQGKKQQSWNNSTEQG